MEPTGPLSETQREAIRLAVIELRAEYAEVLPGLVTELTEVAERACDSANEAELRHLRTLAHRMRGAAGSYGFAGVSLTTGRVEDILYEREKTKGAQVDDALREALAEALLEVRETAARELELLAPQNAAPAASDDDESDLT